MEKIFKYEHERITMDELRRHKYVDLPSLTQKVESKTISLDTKDEELRYSSTRPTTNGNAKTLTIQSESIPPVTTKKAKDISQLLRSTVGVEKLREVATTIKQSIEETKKATQQPSSDENPQGEGVTQDNKHDEQCQDELKKLLDVVNKALDSVASS
ncbi:hypothetical protein RFI_08315 [Reticulomyxa filosa]|uniref:Uncharacterized protein n=1 Tax=Reticulomyxa filosa TaxID=46433 RepID=X6NS32_RETFI|nr:hypothetical protein RFI_08315 [Reticulomyxa filosa]|eukprot:ETO28811.1 hypothetical protein RFI_08315 [Reticulomyxa filosa]